MDTVSLKQIKTELHHLDREELVTVCLRLAKFKKDSKELLHYLLFEASDEEASIAGIQAQVEEQFADMNTAHVYYAKKSTQKIVRQLNKYIRYSGLKKTKVEILLHFCKTLLDSGIPIYESKVLVNPLYRQYNNIHKAWSGLHEDLQYDYEEQLSELESRIRRL